MLRSLLFIPGSTPNKLIHIDAMGADGVILDLEDAVSLEEKDAARILTRYTMQSLCTRSIQIIVRINAIDSPYWRKDLAEIVPLRPDLVMPPKVKCAADIQTVDAELACAEKRAGISEGTIGMLPLIEMALGVENAFSIASASNRVKGLLLGGEDLTADLQCKRTKAGAEILYARTRLVCAARAAGVDVFDTPFTDVHDDEGLQKDAEFAKGLGFSGKAAISPRHVEAINSAFTPTEQEISNAYEVLEAIATAEAEGKGVASLHGKMVDAPVVARAKSIINTMEMLGMGRQVL
ncbi:MAG: aldolase/citrate lyase family protein [Clostridia bacterium]